MKRREFITLVGSAAAVAARGERAAARADTTHRRAQGIGRRAIRTSTTALRRVRAGPGAIGLDRRAQPADRVSLGHRPIRTTSASTRRNWSRSHPTSSWPRRLDGSTVAASDPHRADRVCRCRRSGRGRPGRRFGAAGRQRHRLYRSNTAWRKWLELLKEIAPGVTQVAVLRDRHIGRGSQFAAIQTVAPSLEIEVIAVGLRDAGEIEHSRRGFCTRLEWRADRDGSWVWSRSRSDRHAGGAAQAACGLLRPPSSLPAA